MVSIVLLQAMNPKRHQVLVQCVALKMLTDFTLMYSSCVGVLLKRDGELAAREAGYKTPSKGLAPGPTGTLFRCCTAVLERVAKQLLSV